MRLRGAGWLYASQVITMVVGFTTSVVLARSLGPSGKGTVTVTQTIASIGGVVLALGLPGAAGYLGAKGLVGGRTEAKIAWAAAATVTIVPLAGVVVFGPAIAESLFQTPSATFVILGVVALLPTIVGQICSSYLLGVGRPKTTSLVNIVASVMSLVGMSVLGLGGVLTPGTAILWWLAAVTIAALALTLFTVNTDDSRQRLSALGAVRVGSRFGVASWMSSGFQLLALRADAVLLAMLSTTAAVGVYSIGVSIAEVSWFLPNALYGVLFPKVAAEGRDTQHVVAKLSRLTWPIVLLTALGLTLTAYLIVPLVFGPAFAGSVAVIAALVPGATSAAVSNVLTSFFGGIGRPVYATISTAANLLLNIILNLVLIPRLGIVGAAVSSSISYTLGAALTLLLFRRETGLPWALLLIPTTSDIRELAAIAGSRLRRGRQSRDV